MTKGEIVGNIFFIDVKDRGRLQISKINISIWRLLEILFSLMSNMGGDYRCPR
jgi:hypothetical protein